MAEPHEEWSDEQERTAVAVDGHHLEMAYRDEGGGEPVVFLHGVPTWSFLWHRVAPPLAEEYRTVVPDLVGYGNSASHDGFDRSIRAQEGAVADLLDALGLEQVTLVAHDTGGGVALRLAAHTDRVERLVLSNAACYDSWPVEFVANLGLPGTADVEPDAFEGKLDLAFGEGTYGEADSEFVAGMKAPWLGEGGRRALARAAVATNTNHTTEIAYGDIETDLLCLWGAGMQPIAQGERLVEDVGGRLVGLEESYHWVPEDRADAYLRELRSFLGGA